MVLFVSTSLDIVGVFDVLRNISYLIKCAVTHYKCLPVGGGEVAFLISKALHADNSQVDSISLLLCRLACFQKAAASNRIQAYTG